MKTFRIEDICQRITSGGTPSRKRDDYYETKPDGHLWVKSKELLDASISETEEHISDLGLKGSSAKYLEAGTVLVAMYGANVGQLGWLRNPATVNQAICGLTAEPSVADFRWLFYALMHHRHRLIAMAQGAAQQNISAQLIKAFELPVPPLPTQQRIAAILSAYDDLIENNTRRIAILEEMARRLYEEWFVHFRFPGHGEVAFDDGRPKEWSRVKLKSIARLRSGYAFKSKTFTDDGKHRLVTIKNVQDSGFEPNNVNRLDDVPSNVPQHCHLVSGDLLLSLTGNVGRVCIVYGGEFLLNQRVAKIEPVSSEYRAFLYFGFKDRAFRQRLENLATGVAQQNLSPVKTEELEILLPNQDSIELFEAFAGAVMAQCSQLDETNANLRAQRDLLLPKLVSGEIDVSQAQAGLEAAE